MQNIWRSTRRRFWIVNYIVLFVLVLSVASQGLTGPAWGFTLAAAAGYALVYLLPVMLLAGLARYLPAGEWLASLLAVLGSVLVVVLLYTDKVVFGMYGFHLNGFVWNLIITPGGIASLESSTGTKVAIVGIGIGLVAGELLLFWVLRRFFRPAPGTVRWLRWAVVAIVLCMLGERTAFGLSHFNGYRPVLLAAQQVPFYQPTTFAHFLKALGQEPARQTEFELAGKGRLHYPLHPIAVQADAPRPNIVVLVSESLRWDMLTPEIMPNLWAFAEKNWRYTNHYSGGNGTRWGIFTLFYGMPASYWFSFLDARQPPALVTLLQQQDYRFGLYTSAKFTYPEFDKTIWAGLPSSLLHSDDDDVGWKDDRENVARLDAFIDEAERSGDPFFGFLFFESTHARYFFPDDAVIRPDYLEAFNYATVDVGKNIELIKNRYINASHSLDRDIGRVIEHLRSRGFLENTIVIVTGDHGEEFMENGRWGHNSAFHNEQLHVPFVLHVPGHDPRVINKPTSHLDIAPTLMPLLGVTNPPQDYSVAGVDLLHPVADRFRVVGSWNALGYIGAEYKIAMPMKLAGMSYMRVAEANDQPVDDPDRVIAEEKPNLVRLLSYLSHFYRK